MEDHGPRPGAGRMRGPQHRECLLGRLMPVPRGRQPCRRKSQELENRLMIAVQLLVAWTSQERGPGYRPLKDQLPLRAMVLQVLLAFMIWNQRSRSLRSMRE